MSGGRTVAAVACAVVALAGEAEGLWYYRGTTNNWEATEMVEFAAGKVCVNEELSRGDEFKVSAHYDDWSEAYPAHNVRVERDGRYQVCFDPATHAVTARRHDEWYFRGTPNGWGATAMTLTVDRYCTTALFTGDGEGFKITNSQGRWEGAGVESYPEHNWVIYQGAGEYEVCFFPEGKRIEVRLLESTPEADPTDVWWLRGTNNEWKATPMQQQQQQGSNEWCITTEFRADGEFKVSRWADTWVEAYPVRNWRIHQGAGTYDVCFSEETKEIRVNFHEQWWLRRGNGMDAVKMYVATDGQFCTRQYFVQGEGFKVTPSPTSWDGAFPINDWVIYQGSGLYAVCYDSLWTRISVDKLFSR